VRLAETFRFAIGGILANKMRSLLTMLGILIGVASVITLVAVGTGSSRDVQASISRLGSNTLFVLPLQEGSGGNGRGIGAQIRRLLGIKSPPVNGTVTRAARLNFEDADALRDPVAAPHVKAVAPAVVIQQAVVGVRGGHVHPCSDDRRGVGLQASASEGMTCEAGVS
jgi:putative ABC transport system permease protein